LLAEKVFALAVAAGDGELVLSWEAPRECPTRDEVLARARERIGERASAGVEASAVISARGEKWRLELEIAADGGTVHRAIDGGSCEALADAAALVLAMAAAARPSAETSTAAAETVAETTPAPVAPTRVSRKRLLDMRAEVHEAVASRSDYVDPTVAERDSSIPSVRVAVAGGLDLAGVPGIGGTLAFELGLHWTRTRIVAYGVHAIERRTAVEHASAVHRMTAAGLGLCRLVPLGAHLERGFEIGACARTELGRVRTRGLRGTDLSARSSMWFAGTLGATAAWWVAEHWSLGVSVDAVVPLRRYRIRIDDAAVGLVGVVGLRALAGLAVRLP